MLNASSFIHNPAGSVMPGNLPAETMSTSSSPAWACGDDQDDPLAVFLVDQIDVGFQIFRFMREPLSGLDEIRDDHVSILDRGGFQEGSPAEAKVRVLLKAQFRNPRERRVEADVIVPGFPARSPGPRRDRERVDATVGNLLLRLLGNTFLAAFHEAVPRAEVGRGRRLVPGDVRGLHDRLHLRPVGHQDVRDPQPRGGFETGAFGSWAMAPVAQARNPQTLRIAAMACDLNMMNPCAV